MNSFRVEAILINAQFDKAFGYIAAPENLPQWTHAFKSVQNGKAVLTTPAGAVAVGLSVHSSRVEGTIDWRMRFPDGNEANAFSRLVRQSEDTCIYSFVLLAPPVPLEQLEGALAQQADILRRELQKLRQILNSA